MRCNGPPLIWRIAVKCKSGNLEPLKNRLVRFKFTLCNASFYAYWFARFEPID